MTRSRLVELSSRSRQNDGAFVLRDGIDLHVSPLPGWGDGSFIVVGGGRLTDWVLLWVLTLLMWREVGVAGELERQWLLRRSSHEVLPVARGRRRFSLVVVFRPGHLRGLSGLGGLGG